MSLSKLEQLKQMTTVVADTGELDAIKRLKPEDATTNPTLVLKAIQSGQYQATIEKAKTLGESEYGTPSSGQLADCLAVCLGAQISENIEGLISTEVDARLSFDTEATIEKARTLIHLYSKIGVDKSRILIKIASTWEGIQAAKVLEQENIHCNLTLLFSFAQAKACADAGAFLISPFVGRILDWYKKSQPDADYSGANDPGVQSVTSIYNYYKEHGIKTVVMGASFRTQDEIENLAGCDKLTISPALLDSLAGDQGELTRMLKPASNTTATPTPITEKAFRLEMNQDAMATEKLAEGIRSFIADIEKLEALLSQ
ncbi:transaldolase [Gynuella sp.]|uniref:transaldolase n=1 Tax=Gynuella sp. TaxID=2969146 RepID=UPI003D1433A6